MAEGDPIKSRLAISVGAARGRAARQRGDVRGQALQHAARRGAADRHHLVDRVLAIHGGRQDRPQASPTPKPLVEKVADAKPVDDPAPKSPRSRRSRRRPRIRSSRFPRSSRTRSRRRSPTQAGEETRAAEAGRAEEPDSKPDPIAEALKKDDAKKPPEKKVEEKKAEAKPTPPKKPAKEYKFDPKQIAALLDKRDPQRQAATGAELNATASLGLRPRAMRRRCRKASSTLCRRSSRNAGTCRSAPRTSKDRRGSGADLAAPGRRRCRSSRSCSIAAPALFQVVAESALARGPALRSPTAMPVANIRCVERNGDQLRSTRDVRRLMQPLFR